MAKNEAKKYRITPKTIMVIFIALAVIAASVAFIVDTVYENEPKVTHSFIDSKLEGASELTAAKLTYNGIVKYSDGKIPYINENAFNMIYRAKVTAGIDVSSIESKITSDQVILTIPQVEILDISIAEDSIQFYDNKFALFKWDSKDDVVVALQEAKANVEAEGNLDELKTTAESQTELLLKALFAGNIGDRELVIEWAES